MNSDIAFCIFLSVAVGCCYVTGHLDERARQETLRECVKRSPPAECERMVHVKGGKP